MKSSVLIICFLLITSISYSHTGIIYPDPNLPGSTTAGIQEAVNSCPPGGCEIRFACNTTYDITAPATPWGSVINIDKQNLKFKGCGMDSSIIRYIDNFSSSGVGTQNLFNIRGNSRDITLEDFRLELNDTCDTGDCKSSGSALSVFGTSSNPSTVRNVLANRVHFHTPSNDNPNITNLSEPRSVWIRYNRPSKIRFTQCQFHSSGRSFEIESGDDVSIENSWFAWINQEGKRNGTSLLHKYIGVPSRFVNNSFDANGGGYAAITLTDPFNNVNNIPSEFIQFGWNTIYNLGVGETVRGLYFQGYDKGLLSNNTFICESPEECQGIQISDEQDCYDCNRGNTISNNIFINFSDDNNLVCPIHINASLDDNVDNLITNNQMFLDQVSSDGFCGDASQLLLNHISGNYTNLN